MSIKIVKIDEVAETSSGGTPSRGNKSFYGGNIPWVKSGELPDGEITKVEEHITQQGLENSSTKLLETGTLLIAMYGATVGKLGILTFPAVTNQAVCAIHPGSSLDTNYLFYWLLNIRKYLIDSSFGGAQPNISQTLIRDIEIPLPSIKTQRQIATKLKAQLAEVVKAQKSAQEQLRDVKILHYRTLELLFAELDSTPKYKIGDFAETTSGSTPSRSQKDYWEPKEIPWIKTGEVAFLPITMCDEYISKKALKECSIKLLPVDTVLVAMYGQGKTRGQSAILKMEATINQACFAILPNETWEPEFLYWWLRYSYQNLRDLSDDRGGNQANLNGALMKAFEVPAPTKTKQREIVKKINSALNEIDIVKERCEASLKDINSLPNRLLTNAFNKL